MTESVRRRTSKWDLKEDPKSFQSEIGQDSGWSVKENESDHGQGSKSEWKSKKNSDDPKWSDMEPRSPLRGKGNSGWSSWGSSSGNRAEQEDENPNRYSHEISETKSKRARDQSYSSSPGRDGWRRRSRSRSPKNGWSRSCRSRSRSPSYGFRRDSEGRQDTTRGGSGLSRPSREYARGRSSRGSQSRFPHEDNHDYDVGKHAGSGSAENWASRHEKGGSSGNSIERDFSRNKNSHGHENHYDESWEKQDAPRNGRSSNLCNDFLKGRCYRGSSCRYTHDDALADDHGTTDMLYKRRDTSASFAVDYKREPRNANIPCKFFAAGTCRNGNNCRFFHEGTPHERSEEKSWDSRRGGNLDNENRSRVGSKFHDAADSARGSLDRRSQNVQWGQNLDNAERSMGGARWNENTFNSDITLFQQRKNDEDCGKIGDRAENKSLVGPKWNENAGNSDAAKFQQWRNNDDYGKNNEKAENKLWNGPKWNNDAGDPDITNSSLWRNNDNGVKVGIPVSQPSDRWDHSLNDRNSDKPAGLDVHKSLSWTGGDNRGNMGIWVSRDQGESLHAVSMPSVGSEENEFRHLTGNGETGFGNQGLQSGTPKDIAVPNREQAITPEVSGQQHYASTVMLQPTVSRNVHIQQHGSLIGNASTFPSENREYVTNGIKQQTEVRISEGVLPTTASFNGQSFIHKENTVNQGVPSFQMERQGHHISPSPALSVQTFDLNGPSQEMTSHTSSSPQVHRLSHVGETIKRSDAVDQTISPMKSGFQISRNVVTSEQVAQITNLSASLAQILEKGQQLPELYATLNSSHSKVLLPSPPIPAGLGGPVLSSFVQSNQGSWPQTQYNPISNNIQPSNTSIRSPGFLSGNPVEQDRTTEQGPETTIKSIALSSADGENGGDPSSNDGLEKTLQGPSLESKQLQPVDNERTADHIMKEKETAHLEDINPDSRGDEEGKKNKDSKGIRPFKFALVEFIKEILKPTWKEGQMSKEAHKTIVKKVVDKVTGALPGDHTLQTQEKIDHYLSYSKPKLTKLVQAYVEKYVKS